MERKNKYFNIIFPHEFNHYIDDIIYYIEYKLNEIMLFFNLPYINKINIYLYNDKDLYKSLCKGVYPLGNIGGSYGYYNVKVYADMNNVSIEKLWYCIMHEITHFLYVLFVQEKGIRNRVVWFDEGLAVNLSGEKDYLNDNALLKEYLKSKIFSKDKIIPNIEYLKVHGNVFGKFIDGETNKYNGYDWSYLMIRYLIETRDDFDTVMRIKKDIEGMEENIIINTSNYFKKKILEK